jgi:hypothetical protein
MEPVRKGRLAVYNWPQATRWEEDRHCSSTTTMPADPPTQYAVFLKQDDPSVVQGSELVVDSDGKLRLLQVSTAILESHHVVSCSLSQYEIELRVADKWSFDARDQLIVRQDSVHTSVLCSLAPLSALLRDQDPYGMAPAEEHTVYQDVQEGIHWLLHDGTEIPQDTCTACLRGHLQSENKVRRKANLMLTGNSHADHSWGGDDDEEKVLDHLQTHD